MSKGENGISAYDYSNLESILLDGIVLTNPLVDYIHGVLPEGTSDEKKKRLQDLFLGILDMGEEITSRCNLAHSPPEPESESWHHLCQMRRVISRIFGPINGKFHRKALDAGKNKISVHSLARLRQLNSKIINTIIQRSRNITLDILKENRELDGKEKSKIHWYDVATVYEAAFLHRSRGEIGVAIELANNVGNCQNEIIEPPKSETIEGLVSFNFAFWECTVPADNAEPRDLFTPFSTPQRNLMTLSEIISRNSSHAASMRLNTNQAEDQTNLYNIALHIDNVCGKSNLEIRPSSISHIEGLFRVLLYQGITNHNVFAGLDSISHLYAEKCLMETVPDLMKRCKYEDPWIERMVDADLNQKLGIFLSSNTKSFLAEENSAIPEEISSYFTPERKLSVLKLVQNTWTSTKDSDSYVRGQYREAAISDLRSREIDICDSKFMPALTRLLGESCGPNPLTSEGLASWFSTDKGDLGTSSRHLRHFPQGKINESQVAVHMALMQQIMRLETGGVWEKLDEIIKLDNQEERTIPWKISKVGSGPRLQFTVGYFSKSYSPGELHNEKTAEKLRRQYLTRVNRADEIMLISSAISMMSKVIHSQLKGKKPAEMYFLENLYLCDNDEIYSLRDDETSTFSSPSLQELFYLSREISNSPIRVFEPTHHAKLRGRKNVKKDDLDLVFDNILRISFARIYSLSIATEHLARILVQRPLREPFLSCCVLLVDQIRVLLQNLQESLLAAYSKYKIIEEDLFNQTIFTNLNQMKNKFKPNYFKNLKQIDLIDDSDDEITEVRSDLAIEYFLAYKRTREEHVNCLKRLYNRLEFKENIGKGWKEIFENAVKLRYDYPAMIDAKDVDTIAPDWKSEYVEIKKNDGEVIELFNKLVSENSDDKQLRVLWSRLLWYPTSFVGRVMVNANSPREINTGENPVPLLFGNTKQSFVSNQ